MSKPDLNIQDHKTLNLIIVSAFNIGLFLEEEISIHSLKNIHLLAYKNHVDMGHEGIFRKIRDEIKIMSK